MRWCWVLPVVCTGCLQPNPSFAQGSTSSAAETASGTEPGTSADDHASSAETMSASHDGTSVATSPTTSDPTTDDGSGGPGTTGTAPVEHTIFVSSSDNDGSFGRLAVVDTLCTELATNAGLGGGTWLAILSSSTIDARDRIAIGGEVRNIVGDLIAEDGPDLWDGFVGAPVRYTEMGNEFLASPYTGTQADGTAAADNCADWTALNGTNGAVGDAGYASSTWIESGVANCNLSLPFYCISQ